MPVVIALTSNGALAANVQGGEGVHLARARDSGDHAELLLDFGVGRGGLHAPELERRPLVFVQIGEDVRSLHRLGRKTKRGASALRARSFGNRRAVFGDEHAGDAVVRADALQVAFHDFYAGRAA